MPINLNRAEKIGGDYEPPHQKVIYCLGRQKYLVLIKYLLMVFLFYEMGIINALSVEDLQ